MTIFFVIISDLGFLASASFDFLNSVFDLVFQMSVVLLRALHAAMHERPKDPRNGPKQKETLSLKNNKAGHLPFSSQIR